MAFNQMWCDPLCVWHLPFTAFSAAASVCPCGQRLLLYHPAFHTAMFAAATTVEKTLQRLGSKFEVVPLPGDSAFVRPASIMYELDGEEAGAR
jgi:hypothetical protein